MPRCGWPISPFKIDFRFWIVALKLMSAKQFLIFLIYLVPFTAFFVIALHVLHRNFSTMGAGRGALYLTNILALTLGFIVLLVLQYGTLWLTGKLFNPLPDPGFVPLSTIVAIQFVPLLGDRSHYRDLHLAAHRLEPAGRPDLRDVRDLVRGGGHRNAGGVLSQKMGGNCITPWLSPGRLQCYSADAFTHSHPIRTLFLPKRAIPKRPDLTWQKSR